MTAEIHSLTSRHHNNKETENKDRRPAVNALPVADNTLAHEQSQISEAATAAVLLAEDFGIDVDGLGLSHSQVGRLLKLYRELNEMTGAGSQLHLPEARHRELERVDREIENLFLSSGEQALDARLSRELAELQQRAKDILGEKVLNPAQHERVEAIQSEIDGIFEKQVDLAALNDEVRLEALFSELDDLRRNLPVDQVIVARIKNVRRRIAHSLLKEPYYIHTLSAQFDELDGLLGNAPLPDDLQQQLHQINGRVFEIRAESDTERLNQAQLELLRHLLGVADVLLGRPQFTEQQSARICEINAAIESLLEYSDGGHARK